MLWSKAGPFNWLTCKKLKHSELSGPTHQTMLLHPHEIMCQRLQIKSTALNMMWLLGEPYKILLWPCAQMGVLEAVHWCPWVLNYIKLHHNLPVCM